MPPPCREATIFLHVFFVHPRELEEALAAATREGDAVANTLDGVMQELENLKRWVALKVDLCTVVHLGPRIWFTPFVLVSFDARYCVDRS